MSVAPMRQISFALTTPQFLDGSKDVTRRVGWENLKPGELLTAVEKAQGLKRGQKVKRIGKLRVVDVRREPLRRLMDSEEYGFAETGREGFQHSPKRQPEVFVYWFCKTHKCTPETIVTRIEFVKLPTEEPTT
jgi:hypothetical protein